MIPCALNAAVLSKQRLNLPSCWSGSVSIALWRNPSASNTMAQFVFLASKVLDKFTLMLSLLPSTKEMWDGKELV